MKKKICIFFGVAFCITVAGCSKGSGNVAVDDSEEVNYNFQDELSSEATEISSESITPEEVEVPYDEEHGVVYTTDTSFKVPFVVSCTNEEYSEEVNYSGVWIEHEDSTLSVESVKYAYTEDDYIIVELIAKNDYSYAVKCDWEKYEGEWVGWLARVPLFSFADKYTGLVFPQNDLKADGAVTTVTTKKIEWNGDSYDVAYVCSGSCERTVDTGWYNIDEMNLQYDTVETYTEVCYLKVPVAYDGAIVVVNKEGSTELFREENDLEMEEYLLQDNETEGDLPADSYYYMNLCELISYMGEEVESIDMPE